MEVVGILCALVVFGIVPVGVVLMLGGGAIAARRRTAHVDAALAEVASRLGWPEGTERTAAGAVGGRDVEVRALVEGVGRNRKRWLQIRVRAEGAGAPSSERVQQAWDALAKAGALRLQDGWLVLRTRGWDPGADTLVAAVERLVKLAAHL